MNMISFLPHEIWNFTVSFSLLKNNRYWNGEFACECPSIFFLFFFIIVFFCWRDWNYWLCFNRNWHLTYEIRLKTKLNETFFFIESHERWWLIFPPIFCYYYYYCHYDIRKHKDVLFVMKDSWCLWLIKMFSLLINVIFRYE